ncbi:MAG: polysaccharide biosynthesis tyrosine autokinase [Candidatus Cloacimonetes bacterium]|nr:polysaccharide biosynthesis tyrosine autokinase [Candidatus Cloacimonadota bacterium]
MEPYPEQEIKLKDYLRIILQHRWMIVIIFLVVVTATVFYTIRAPRIYESSGKVLLELKKQTDIFFPTSGFGRNDLNNQMEVIKSTPIMIGATEKLRRHPEATIFPILAATNPERALAKGIDVSSGREVDIIDISYKSINPVEAQAVVNSVIESYQEENLKYSRAEVTNVREFLERQLDITSKKLSISEEDLREYKILHEVFALSAETTEMIKNMVEFEAELSIAQTDLKVAQEKLNYLKAELTKLDASLGKEVISISSPLLEQLRQKLIENESKLAILLTKKGYTAEHPELMILQEEIDNIRSQMKIEIDKILQVDEDTFNPLDRRQKLLTDIISVEVEHQIAKAKKDALESVVEKYSIKMSGLPDAELELARLERAKAINEQIYSMLTTKYEEAKISEEGKVSNIRILERAKLPISPVSPKVKMNILISIILGLGLGVGAAFLLDSLNTKILNLSDVERYVKLPVLGTIPDIPISERKLEEIEDKIKFISDSDEKEKLSIEQRQMAARLVPHYSPKSPIAEAYRTFRTNVVSLPGSSSNKTFLITSSGPKEGKTTTCANLAITLAQMDSKTLLLDCDMRRPMVHNLFYVKRENGLSKYITDGGIPLSEVIKPSGVKNLDLITSGHVPPNPSELLASQKMDQLIEELKQRYDYIIFDSPPLIAVTDAMILAKKADALVLIVRTKITDRGIIDRGKSLLENIGVTAAGVVVNGIEVKRYYSGYKYYYYYYYYYYYADEGKGEKKKRRKHHRH